MARLKSSRRRQRRRSDHNVEEVATKRYPKSPLIAGLAVAAALAFVAAHPAAAQEKIKYGSSIKFTPVFYLPILAAQEQGFFKKHGLDADWFPARSGADMQRDFAADVLPIGSSMGASDIPAMARGVPTIIVADLQSDDNFGVWLPTDSRIHQPKDLKGATLGVSRLGGAEHAYGRLVAERLGIADSVKFTSTGGIRESLALFTTGRIDGVVLSPNQMTPLKLAGKAREILKVADYRPSPWVSFTVTARKAFVEKHPETVKNVVASIIEANRFIMSPKGKPWAIATMEKVSHYEPAVAEALYGSLDFSRDGRIPTKAIANLTDFMVKFGLMKKGEVPPIDQIYTDRFVR